MNVVDIPLNPRLAHAVWFCTRTSGSPLEGQHLQVLQEFLLDSTTVDATYLTIVGRARAQPVSAAVLEKTVELLKRYLPRFRASRSTLQEIASFCSEYIGSLDGSHPGLLSSLHFVYALVAQQSDVKAPSRTLFRQALGAEPGSDNPRADQSSSFVRHQLGTPPRGPDEQMSEQVSSASRSKTDGAQSLFQRHDCKGSNLVPDLLTFSWLSGASSDTCLLDTCAAFVPSLAVESKQGTFTSKVAEGLSAEALADETLRIQQQLTTIASLHQARSRHAAYLSDGKNSEQSGRKRQRPTPYIHSELAALVLNEDDIEAILERVCSPSSLPSGLGDASGGSMEASEMCCSLLSHLLLDLWKRAGPGTSFTLALVLLRRLLDAEKRQTQLRVFDILYNMSVHCENLPMHPKDSASPEQGPDVELATVFSNGSIDKGSNRMKAGNEQAEQIQEWLRMLLFEVLHVLAQRKAASEELWQAGLGCLCQLCSCGGQLKREWMQTISPRAVAALLRRASQFHWPEDVHTQLVRIATNLLYTGEAATLGDQRGSSLQHESRLDSEDILDSMSDGGQSFRTAATEAEAAAPLTCSHSGLALSFTRLQAFGGVEEVARHFRGAASREARRNLLCVILDCIVARLCKGLHGETGEDPPLLESPEDAALVCKVLAASNVADALSAAFICGLPGFALPIASSLSLPESSEAGDGEEVQTLLRLVLEQMEALAVSTAAGELTPALVPGLTHTLASVGHAPAAFQGITGVWACLADLFCSSDPRSAQLAESWLLRLLVAAAERHLEEQEEDAAPALLPSRPSTKAGAQQAQLTAIMRHIMDSATPEVNTAARFVRVAWRLLLVAKQRCSLTHSVSMELVSPPISPPYLRSLRGPARSICTPSPSASKEGSAHKRAPSLDAALHRLRLSEDTFYSASADQEGPPVPPPPSAERPASRFAQEPPASNSTASEGAAEASLPEGQEEEEEEEQPGPEDGADDLEEAESSEEVGGRGDTAREQHRGHKNAARAAEEACDAEPGGREGIGGASERRVLVSEQEEQAPEEEISVWHSYSAVQLSLATMALLVDWLLNAPDPCRQVAFLELGRLLITSLVLPAQNPAQASFLDRGASTAEAMPDSSTAGTPEQNAAGTVSAFLAGTQGVPHDLLSAVSPVMLAHIFHNLPSGTSSRSWSSITERDVRAATLLLLAARCKGSPDDTAAIGGSSFFFDVLEDADPRVRHTAATFLQAHFMVSQPSAYRWGLRQLVMQAQQNAEDRLCNAFQQVSTLLEMRLVNPAV
ncbi:hypothetical protein COCOBI_05-3630 [Coccomyxa sp. Obi]|nr:hypothetical protein COCOBI_05-3630 [Coccomyxa sp. Obi]